MCVAVCQRPWCRPWGSVMAEFVRFTLDDGSEVLFESAESDLVALHGGPPEVRDGGRLTAQLQGVAEAAEEVAASLRARLVPDEVSLEFGRQDPRTLATVAVEQVELEFPGQGP